MRLPHIAIAAGCLLLALSALGGCFERAAVSVAHDAAADAIASAKASESAAQRKADDALAAVESEHQHYDDLQGQVLAARLKIEDDAKHAKQLQATADQAPLRTILHVTEALAVLCILLGVVDIVLSFLWTLPFGKGLGEGLVATGAATLVTCYLLGDIIDHIKALCAFVVAALLIYAYVIYHRAHKTVVARNAFAAAFHDAVSVLEGAGKGAEAEALKAKHLAGALAQDIGSIWTKLLTRLHLKKAPTVAPAAK